MSKPISDPVFDIGRDLQRAYDEGYKQGRYDEKVETEASLTSGEQTHDMRSDTISRRMAIDALKEKVFSNLTDEFYGAMQVLDELPSAQLERKMDEWIPCSEGLPEYRKLVDVTTRDLRVKLAYLDSIKEDGTDDLWIIPLEDAECALWNIVAWKPRPEPWKGADDDIH